jgi:N-acyl-D-aspartate/D-glutamate deacylase
MRKAVLAALAALLMSWTASAAEFDVVLKGGRVVDPETGLDAIRDVALRRDRIATVSIEPLSGTRSIDATGLVVAPGFIDLHQHEQDAEAYRLKALDGVTTALELETGVPDLARFLAARRGTTLINYGASASHEAARVLAWNLPLPPSTFGPEAAIPDPSEGPVTSEAASPERLSRILELLRVQLQAGALGIGIGLAYTPGATRHEVIELFRLAAQYKRPVFVHMRSGGRVEPGSSIEAMAESIGAAAVTGAPLHIVHINSMCMKDAPECLSMIEGARARGLDVTTEAYPYGAFMTFANSAVFSAGWGERFGMDYSDVVLPASGERLTREKLEKLHASPDPVVVLGHLNSDAVVDAIVEHPLVMIASDGIKEHPRSAGSYAHVFSRYVRSRGTLDLRDVVRKMSLMPAQRLEGVSAAARRKGRLQAGADADIVVFDPAQFKDTATYSSSTAPSVGVRYLLVAGTLVIEEGHIVAGAAPGRPVMADAALQ